MKVGFIRRQFCSNKLHLPVGHILSKWHRFLHRRNNRDSQANLFCPWRWSPSTQWTQTNMKQKPVPYRIWRQLGSLSREWRENDNQVLSYSSFQSFMRGYSICIPNKWSNSCIRNSGNCMQYKTVDKSDCYVTVYFYSSLTFHIPLL